MKSTKTTPINFTIKIARENTAMTPRCSAVTNGPHLHSNFLINTDATATLNALALYPSQQKLQNLRFSTQILNQALAETGARQRRHQNQLLHRTNAHPYLKSMFCSYIHHSGAATNANTIDHLNATHTNSHAQIPPFFSSNIARRG